MKKIELNKNQILEYQQNRDPYLMIDHAEEVVPGISSKGYKLLSENEWFFKVKIFSPAVTRTRNRANQVGMYSRRKRTYPPEIFVFFWH